jgi:predicted dehydrogenase
MSILSRRTFLGQASVAAVGTSVASKFVLAGLKSKRWRAAIIGCTGQGDYGHSLDTAFSGIESAEVVGLADPNEAGRARAAQRAKAPRQYSDYREMPAKERPELVVIAPRWSEKHFEMAMAALNSGAHVLTEKPFTVTLAEADEILATARQERLKIAVAHQMRLAPGVAHLQRALADGLIGELVHLRAWGKQDARAGGEDLIVLGTHIFDLMRVFAGEAESCMAQVFTRGRAITRADAHPATEKIGPIAGDEVETQFCFANGITGSFTSRARLRETLGPWALELMGTKGAVRILMDIDPIVLLRRRIQETAGSEVLEQWVPLAGDPTLSSSSDQRGFGPANRLVVLDWLDAIEHEREPQCSGYNATKALEFVMATYQASLEQQSVPMPLLQRHHPLSRGYRNRSE